MDNLIYSTVVMWLEIYSCMQSYEQNENLSLIQINVM